MRKRSMLNLVVVLAVAACVLLAGCAGLHSWVVNDMTDVLTEICDWLIGDMSREFVELYGALLEKGWTHDNIWRLYQFTKSQEEAIELLRQTLSGEVSMPKALAVEPPRFPVWIMGNGVPWSEPPKE
jgi:hypothetical protein